MAFDTPIASIEDGARRGPERRPDIVAIDLDTPNGNLYPFSLRRKLDGITEPSSWYESADNPWGRPILPFEMYSVLAHKAGNHVPVRGPRRWLVHRSRSSGGRRPALRR